MFCSLTITPSYIHAKGNCSAGFAFLRCCVAAGGATTTLAIFGAARGRFIFVEVLFDECRNVGGSLIVDWSRGRTRGGTITGVLHLFGLRRGQAHSGEYHSWSWAKASRSAATAAGAAAAGRIAAGAAGAAAAELSM